MYLVVFIVLNSTLHLIDPLPLLHYHFIFAALSVPDEGFPETRRML
jgi:hypothetical protein